MRKLKAIMASVIMLVAVLVMGNQDVIARTIISDGGLECHGVKGRCTITYPDGRTGTSWGNLRTTGDEFE